MPFLQIFTPKMAKAKAEEITVFLVKVKHCNKC